MGTIPVRPAREAVQADGDFCHALGEFDEAVCSEVFHYLPCAPGLKMLCLVWCYKGNCVYNHSVWI
jgi:hypothetical protein